MSAPNANVSLGNGAIGGVPASQTGIAGLIGTGSATGLLGGFALGTPKVIYSLPDAVALGITATSTGDNAVAYRHLSEFYNQIPSGVSKLWIMLVPNTMSIAQMVDNTNANGVAKLLNAANGEIRMFGAYRNPATGYTPVVTAGIDQDAITALTNVQILGEAFRIKEMPFRALIEGRGFLIANIGQLETLTTHTSNRAGIVLGGSLNDGSSSVGFALGRAASVSLQVNLGKVKDGAMPMAAPAYVGDTTIEALGGAVDTLHDKGYIFLRKFVGLAGYYFNGNPMAAPASDDYSQWPRGRVIDEAQRISYATYVLEVNDDTLINSDGTMPAAFIAHLTQVIKDAIALQMGYATGYVTVFIDPAQSVTATGSLAISLKLGNTAYLYNINILLGYDNA